MGTGKGNMFLNSLAKPQVSTQMSQSSGAIKGPISSPFQLINCFGSLDVDVPMQGR